MPTRLRALLLAVVLPPAVIFAPAGADASPARSRLEPRLAASLAAGTPAVPVWIEFADKGETGPADLAARLAEAERALAPETRRRRERARVHPIVDWLDLPLEPAYVRALAARGHKVYGHSRWFNHVAVRTSGPELEALASLPFVRRVRPVDVGAPRRPLERGPGRMGVESEPRPPLASRATTLDYGRSLGQLSRLNIPAVHDSGYIGTFVNVAVLDNGFNWYKKHEALRTIPVGASRTWDFIRETNVVQDTTLEFAQYFEHGTATLSALAGRAHGRYLGAAPGCNAILARTEQEGSEKPIEMTWWAQGAEWAEALGADIISASLSYSLFPDSAGTDIPYEDFDGHTTIVTRAAEIAAAKGILVVVSAGNDGNNIFVRRKVTAPADANGDSVIAIAAVDSFGVRAAFSSKGPTVDGRIKPDLAAQGVATWVVKAEGGDPNLYETANGTSFAAPLVAGLAACLMQARPSWPPVWIIQALKRTASRAAVPDTLTGWGIPDGLAALRYVPDTLGVPDPASPLAIRFAGGNPYRSGTSASVRVSLGAASPPQTYRVRVFDAAGREVRRLASGTLLPGTTIAIPWQGDDAHGRTLVPGLYLLDLEGAGRHRTVRVVVLR
jgi:subtilisin family serine protease